MKSKTQIDAMIKRIEDSVEDRSFFLMALEWVVDEGISTSEYLESYVEDKENDAKFEADAEATTC